MLDLLRGKGFQADKARGELSVPVFSFRDRGEPGAGHDLGRLPRPVLLAALGVGRRVFAQAAGGEDYNFMPKGGRALLVELRGRVVAPTARIAQERRTEAQWREFVDAQKKPMTEQERATLAAYLAVNMPLSPARRRARPQLPRDGRDLAWEECQSCHSLFAGYLTQGRGRAGLAQHVHVAFPSRAEDEPAGA